MTDDDKEFIIRALAMHAALTFGEERQFTDERCSLYEEWMLARKARHEKEMDAVTVG